MRILPVGDLSLALALLEHLLIRKGEIWRYTGLDLRAGCSQQQCCR